MLRNSNWRLFSAISLFTLFILLFTGPSSAEVIISLSPAQTIVEENESFTLSIMIEPDVNVSGAELELSYDPALVSITSVTEGDFLKQDGESTIFSKGTIDNEQGSVTGMYSVIMGDDVLLETGTFATISLNSKENSGITDIKMNNVVITNSSGDKLPVTIKNAEVQVGDVETATVEENEDAQDESQLSGQNTLIPLVFALMCIYIMKRK